MDEMKMETKFEGTEPKVCWVNIDKADNGYIVRYSTREPKIGAGKYDHVESTEKTMLFNKEQQDEAFELFVKMKKKELDNDDGKYY